MSNGDPVTQKQFYDTMSDVKKDIIEAVGDVDGKVDRANSNINGNAITLATLATKQDGDRDRIKTLEDAKDSQTNWNRGLATVEGLLAVALAALGIREQ